MNKIKKFLGPSLMFILMGCTKTPGKVAVGFLEDVNKGELSAAVAAFSPQIRSSGEDKIKAILAAKSEEYHKDNKDGIKSIAIKKEEVAGETATVTLELELSEGKKELQDFKLLKIEGKWLLNN